MRAYSLCHSKVRDLLSPRLHREQKNNGEREERERERSKLKERENFVKMNVSLSHTDLYHYSLSCWNTLGGFF